MVGLTEERLLELIGEAVKYCQRVRALGMPAAAYAKALREPVHFLWEPRFGKGKFGAARYRSRGSVGVRDGRGALVYDHAIPFRDLAAELLALTSVTNQSLKAILDRFGVVVIVTKEEDARLSSAGLGRTMPIGWDRSDPLARYKHVGMSS